MSIKLRFLNFPNDYFPENLDSFIEKQSKHFYLGIKEMER